jgi:hypothetical protein
MKQNSEDKRFRASSARAVVIGRWADDTVLLRMDDGTTVEAEVPEALRDRFEIGDLAELDFDEDRLVRWGLAGAR